MLTKEQQELKEGSIGGTVANVLMTDETGDELQHAYEVVAGITPEDDFTDNWPVNRGSHMEGFALDWHERKNGPLIERGRVVQHPKYAFIRVTLDCYRPTDRATLDYKDCGGFRKLRDILNSYSAQAVLQRWCRQADRCIILLSH
ncbi:MAG TPA: YqaJ viral recombinase family protein, partial [Povalibacter sp.]|nr:YqaJ viral recombinase family protein [Povalibacter sp.]